MRSATSHRSIADASAPVEGSSPVQSEAVPPTAESEFLTKDATFYFWRGRVALYILLKSLGIGAGDAVIVQGFTCFAVPSAVLFTGARPLYADIEPTNFNLSLGSIRAVHSANRTSAVRAIIVQHTFGVPADLNAIVPWAREQGIAIIEDCAHVWGSRYLDATRGWVELGTAGDAAFFSSQWTKPVSTGLGGWAVVRYASLARSVAQLYQTECAAPTAAASALLAAQVYVRSMLSASWIQFASKAAYQGLYRRGLLVGTSTPDELQGRMPVGYSKQMSGFQRRLLAKRVRDTRILQHRRHLKSVYDAALAAASLPTVSLPTFADPVLLRYPVRVSNKKKILECAERRHIEIGDWYTAPVDRPENLPGSLFAYLEGECPEGERASREVVNLPMHLGINEQRAHRVVELLQEIA